MTILAEYGTRCARKSYRKINDMNIKHDLQSLSNLTPAIRAAKQYN